MSKIVPTPPPGFDDLSVDEQIDFVQSLWDRIAATAEQVPVPEWHRQIIRERLAAYKANPGAGRPWTDVRTDIERKLRERGSDGWHCGSLSSQNPTSTFRLLPSGMKTSGPVWERGSSTNSTRCSVVLQTIPDNFRVWKTRCAVRCSVISPMACTSMWKKGASTCWPFCTCIDILRYGKVETSRVLKQSANAKAVNRPS